MQNWVRLQVQVYLHFTETLRPRGQDEVPMSMNWRVTEAGHLVDLEVQVLLTTDLLNVREIGLFLPQLRDKMYEFLKCPLFSFLRPQSKNCDN